MLNREVVQARLHEAKRRFLIHRSEEEFNLRVAEWEREAAVIAGPVNHPKYLGWTEFHSTWASALAEAIMTAVAEMEAEEAKKASTKTKARSGKKKGPDNKNTPANADMEVGSWD
jgi:hypothetical protein